MTENIEKELNNFRQYAKEIGMTAEEYAVNLHGKNQVLKAVLLESRPEFKSFVSEYHEILDDMTTYKETEAKKGSIEHFHIIQKVIELLSTTSQDPKLLAQLFQHYPQGIEAKMAELNRSTF